MEKEISDMAGPRYWKGWISRAPKGAGLVEYSMVAGLVSVLAIGSVLATGDEVSYTFCRAADKVKESLYGEPADCMMKYQHHLAALEEATEDPGISGGDFIDLDIDPGARGSWTVSLPVTAVGGDYETFRVVPQSGKAAACRTTAAQEEICTELSHNTTSVTLQDGDRGFGYEVVFPSGPRESYEQVLDLYLKDGSGSDIEHWTVTVSREGEPIIFAPAMVGEEWDFPDHVFPAGTVRDFFWHPLEGEFNSELVFQVPNENTNKNLIRTLCYKEAETGDPVCCGDYHAGTSRPVCIGGYTANRIVFDPEQVTAIGYETLFDKNETYEQTDLVDFWLSPLQDTSLRAEAPDRLVEREIAPVIFEPDFTFSDLTIPAGTWHHYHWIPLEGDFNSNLAFSSKKVSGTLPGGSWTLCKKNEDTGYQNCSGGMDDGSITWGLNDVTHIGFKFVLPRDLTEEVDRIMSLELRPNPATGKSLKAENVRIHRIPEPAKVEPSFSFSDIVFPSDQSSIFPYEVEFRGNFNSDMTWSAQGDVGGSIYYVEGGTRAYRGAGNIIGEDGASIEIPAKADDDDILRLYLKTDTVVPGETKSIDLSLVSQSDPSARADWTIDVKWEE